MYVGCVGVLVVECGGYEDAPYPTGKKIHSGASYLSERFVLWGRVVMGYKGGNQPFWITTKFI